MNSECKMFPTCYRSWGVPGWRASDRQEISIPRLRRESKKCLNKLKDIDELQLSLSRLRHASRPGIKIFRGRMAIPVPKPGELRSRTFKETLRSWRGFCNRPQVCANAAKNR